MTGDTPRRPIPGGHVYLLTHVPSGKRYVGKSINSARARCAAHVSQFCSGTHAASPLLEGHSPTPDDFTWEVVDSTIIEVLDDAEAYYVEHYDTYAPNGLNTALVVGRADRYATILARLEERRKAREDTR